MDPLLSLLEEGIFQSDELNFDVNSLRQFPNSNTAPGGFVPGKVFLINRVHTGEVGHIGKEDCGFKDLVEGGVGCLEDSSEIHENSFL